MDTFTGFLKIEIFIEGEHIGVHAFHHVGDIVEQRLLPIMCPGVQQLRATSTHLSPEQASHLKLDFTFVIKLTYSLSNQNNYCCYLHF